MYSFGQGRRKLWFGLDYFFPPTGALGHGNSNHQSKPKRIKAFDGMNITHISTGNSFACALNEEKDLFVWGRGEYGTLGTGKNNQHTAPIKNELMNEFKEKMGVTLVNFQSIFRMTSGLMSDGKIYSWGVNDSGQMGLESYMGVEISESVNVPSAMDSRLITSPIVEYEVSEMTNVFRLEDNSVIWAGLKLAYEPERLPIPEGTEIKTVGCSDRGFAAIDKDNGIYTRGKFFEINKTDFEENMENGLFYCSRNLFDGRDVKKIGGGWRNRYALVE